MYLLDSNIFLESFCRRVHAPLSEAFLGSLEPDRMGWVTSFAAHGICAIMGKKGHSRNVITFLEYVLAHPGLRVYHTATEHELSAAKIMDHTGLDFDDALQYHVAKSEGLTLVTFDKDFNKIQDIPVYSPVDLVN